MKIKKENPLKPPARNKTHRAASLLESAINIAVKAHVGAREKNGRPYILHPLRVMLRLRSEDEMIVAVLHDVLEDTKWTEAMLARRGFSKRLLHALDCVTKRGGESYDDRITRAESDPLARRVKLADLEDNMDIRRLPEITPKDHERLNKYLRVYRRLTEIEERNRS